MKFESKKIDLTLELTTLAGEELIIKGPTNISAKYATSMMRKWAEYERKIRRCRIKARSIKP